MAPETMPWLPNPLRAWWQEFADGPLTRVMRRRAALHMRREFIRTELLDKRVMMTWPFIALALAQDAYAEACGAMFSRLFVDTPRTVPNVQVLELLAWQLAPIKQHMERAVAIGLCPACPTPAHDALDVEEMGQDASDILDQVACPANASKCIVCHLVDCIEDEDYVLATTLMLGDSLNNSLADGMQPLAKRLAVRANDPRRHADMCKGCQAPLVHSPPELVPFSSPSGWLAHDAASFL
jgi:hypothetical protein